ncbi:two-component system sensor histidine kinase YesM [Paenibacillus endophyticus]|uniref:Two-component system sensor histidine kinase YesM n=1 Tax=Paenibacillus endophyticus TaxID=1294268 RepID=A0A7W5GCM9_9BACL|nr:sensor histidine kinase [Paenibacillus endophyticus]MBB3155574.1 two-component system sensor histidine kinase YesM [Paenibacillus endophyticus]
MPAILRKITSAYKRSVQIRLTSYFLIILVPLVAVSIFASLRSEQILERKVNEQTRIALSSAMEAIDMTMNNIENMSMALATDTNLNELLSRENSHLTADMTMDFNKVLNQLSNMNSVNNYLTQFSIFHAYSETVLSSRYGGRRMDGLRNQPWYDELLNSGGKRLLLIPRADEFDSYQQLDQTFQPGYVTLMLAMDPFKPDVRKHVLMITLSSSHLQKHLDTLVHANNASVYLMNSDNRLIAGTNPDVTPPQWTTGSDYTVNRQSGQSGDPEMLVRYRSAVSGWTIMMVKPASAMYAEINQLRTFMYVIISMSFLLSLVISWVVYQGIASPLRTLAYGMKQVRIGQLNTNLPHRREDEFGYLMQSFNEMALEQKHLIKNNYEQQLLRLNAELRVMQSQINPHFLYNTLDSIYSMAENYEAEEITEMVLNLSKFFRLSLSKGQDEFTVAETIEHLQYYLTVQRIRFIDKLSVSVQIDEASKSCLVLKLLLQPIVENAILHGLEQKKKDGHVKIDCRVEQGKLRLEVSDNGKGISLERLGYIRDELSRLSLHADKVWEHEIRRHDLYGLWNVKARLKLYYGDPAELTIDSIENEGTTVVLWIPIGGAYESRDRGRRASAAE